MKMTGLEVATTDLKQNLAWNCLIPLLKYLINYSSTYEDLGACNFSHWNSEHVKLCNKCLLKI